MTTTKTDFYALLANAHDAGARAMGATTPRHMIVSDPVTGERWDVPQGPCGFAWVWIPATTDLARWIRKHKFELSVAYGSYDRSVIEADGGHWSKAYGGGYELWVWGGGQSVDLKAAYARAYAEVLRDAGYEARSGSRLD